VIAPGPTQVDALSKSGDCGVTLTWLTAAAYRARIWPSVLSLMLIVVDMQYLIRR
jgi:hypothetical protein